MITLTIKKKDGSDYWAPLYFNSQEECDKWLADEMTRSYWDADFSTEIVETLPPVKPPPDPVKEAELAAARLEIKTKDQSEIKSTDEITDLVFKMATILGLR